MGKPFYCCTKLAMAANIPHQDLPMYQLDTYVFLDHFNLKFS